jgi:hypothetical protein
MAVNTLAELYKANYTLSIILIIRPKVDVPSGRLKNEFSNANILCGKIDKLKCLW